jgi:uncharacterized protein
MESSIERTRRGYEAFARGDLDAIRDMFHPDIIWEVPGRSGVSGTYRGIDAVIGYFVELFTRSNGTFKAELVDCGELSSDRVAARVRITGTMSGGDMDTEIVTTFRENADGKTVEVLNYSRDQYAMDESDATTPAGLVKRGYAAFATGDMDTLRELLAPDIVWRMPGRSAVAGDHRGIDDVLAFFGMMMERSGGTFRAELVGCAEVVPGTVCALQRTTGALPGGSLEATTVNVFRIEGGRAVEVIEHLSDGYAYDAAMGEAITLPDARRADQATPIGT